MEKVTRTYVEKLYGGLEFSRTSVSEIEGRDPMVVENDGKMIGFRFYDKELIIDGENIYEGKEANFSNWIFWGKRVNSDEVKLQYGDNSDFKTLIRIIEQSGCQYVCQTQVGTLFPMQDTDMTFREALELAKEAKALAMFEKLRKYIGKDVSYTGWLYGVKQEDTAVLNCVNDFIDVEIGGVCMPFIGYGAAISGIASNDGEVLYSNPYIKNEYDKREPEDVHYSRKLMFGSRIADIELEEIEKQNKSRQ